LLSALDTKLQLLRLYIGDLQSASSSPQFDDMAAEITGVLRVRIESLIREKMKVATTFDDIATMSGAIRVCQDLISYLRKSQSQRMHGWFHGIVPRNSAHALSNLLRRIILELSEVVLTFGTTPARS